MKEKVIGILKTQIVSSLFFILLGFCLIIMPITMVNIICKIIFGLLLVCSGVYHVFLYVKANKNPNLLDIFSGVLLLVLGVFLFFNHQVIVKLLPVLLGAFILIDSIWIFQGCIDMRKNNRAEWKVFILINIIFMVLGIVLIFCPFEDIKDTIIFAGCIMFLKGITDIVFLIYKNKKEKPKNTEQPEMKEVMSVQEQESQVNMPGEKNPESEKNTGKTEEVLEEWRD